MISLLLVTKIYNKSEDFFIQLLYACLHLTNNNFPVFISIEEIFDQPIFLKPHTRMDFKHPTQEYLKFTIIRGFSRFLQPGLISSAIFHKDFTRFSCCQLYKIFKLIMRSIPNYWKHLRRTETSQKSLLNIFCYNNKVTWKIKDSQKLSILYKRIHFFLPLNPAIHRMGGQHTKYSASQM